jgi:class 3 adenylate cyclase
MVVFGAPVAHGNDARRALRAALQMHAAASAVLDCDGAPLRLHVGVASGEVVAATINAGGTAKYSVTGDTVNLAARLDALAESGETLISDALYREVSGIVEAESCPERELKGFAAPVPIWRVVGLREARDDRLPFVGRQAELRQLIGVLDAVRETGVGATVLIRGDAGIGKSRLVEEIRARAGEQGFDTISGQVLDFGVGKGQDAIPTLLKGLLCVDPLADEAMRRAALDAAMQRGIVTEDEAPFVNDWLELPQPRPLEAIFESMDNSTRLRRASESLNCMMQRAAAVRPQLLLVEDVHWASPELLRHAAALARAAAKAPVILLLTSRIEGDPIDRAWRASIHDSPFVTVDLTPLRQQEALLLTEALGEASSRFAALCVERAEGNPLFLEQLLRCASAGDSPGLSPAVPPTIQSLVLERMDRLAAPDRAALQAAAVIGKRFSRNNLCGICDEPDLNCDALVAANLVRPDSSDFLFAHALIQEAVYASTLKSRRRDLHRAAARWFMDSDLVLFAEHLDRAEDAGAAHAYLRAATQEAARQHFETALRLAERGGVLAANVPREHARTGCDLALLRGEVLREIGRSSESIVAFQAALELAVDDRQRCSASMGIAAGYRVTGDFSAAMNALGQAESIAARLELTLDRSWIHHTRGNLFFAQGQIADCEAQHLLALRFAEQCADPPSQARALSGLGDARYAQGRMRSALDYFQRSVAMCAEQIRISGPNRCMACHCLWYENQLPDAIAGAQSARADAKRFGVVPVQVFAMVTVTQLLTEAGRFEEAEAACTEALALARRAGSRRYEALMLMLQAEHKLRLGDRAQARDNLEQAFALARQTGLGFMGAALQGRLARASETPAGRAQCLAQGEAMLRDTGLAHSHLWFYREAIEASLAAQEWAAALRYADALDGVAKAEPLPWVDLYVQRARCIVATLQSPDDPAAKARLRQVRATAVAGGNGWALEGIDRALARS